MIIRKIPGRILSSGRSVFRRWPREVSAQGEIRGDLLHIHTDSHGSSQITKNSLVKPSGNWLATVLLIHLLLGIIIAGIFLAQGQTFREGLKTTAPGQIVYLRQPGSVDSWWPMLHAYWRKAENPANNLYEIFFHDRVKFQYPPSSLLLFDVFPRSLITLMDGNVGAPLIRILSWMSRLAVLLTVIVSAIILEICLARLFPTLNTISSGMARRVLLSLLLGFTYYPLLKGYSVGQIQVFLNAFIAYAILFRLLGWEVLCGAFFGVCCLVKPQYGIILLWSLLRRNWRFLVGFATICLVGLAVSVARFGLQDHVAYLKVLSEISRHGETYWPNQSVNGLLNRWLENGSPTQFSTTTFAPFHPVVYAATMISSFAILALALLSWGRVPGGEADSIDLMIVLAAVTIASPVAWEHHYGTFLPIFAVAVPGLLYFRPLGRTTAPLLAVSYVAMAGVMLRSDLLFRNRWVGLAGSHLFFGALVLFGLLLALRVKYSGKNPLNFLERSSVKNVHGEPAAQSDRGLLGNGNR